MLGAHELVKKLKLNESDVGSKFDIDKMLQDMLAKDWTSPDKDQMAIAEMMKGIFLSQDKDAQDFVKALEQFIKGYKKQEAAPPAPAQA
jgi:hypothetical protein